MALTKTDTAESVFNEFGLHNREALRRFAFTLLSALLVGCGGGGSGQQQPLPQEQVIVFTQSGPFNLVVGDTLFNPASGGLGTGTVSYSSSDTTVATVDGAGQLTVVGAGTAAITAEKAADTQYTAASASYVVQTTLASQAIGFDQPGPFHLMVSDTLSNVASGGPGTGVISYSSSNTTVATVDGAGQLTVVGIGTATITAEKAADAQYMAASASYTVNAPSRVPMTAWVGSTNTKVDLPLWASDMLFFRSTEANCDVSNVHSCANGQWDRVTGGQTVEDTAFTLNQSAYYVLQHGASQASLEVSTERFVERSSHQVVAHNNRLWVIGGNTDGARKNDVWWSVDDGKTWTEAMNSAPFSPRYHHQVVAHNNRLWVIGGWDGGNKNDVWWSEDGATWTEATGSANFSPRNNHQVVAHNNRLWVIGGWDGGNKNDVWWSEDGATWNEATSNADFSPRYQHQVVAHNNRLWVIGGLDGSGRKNDVWWSEDGATWNEATNSADFSSREGHQVVTYNNRLWLIGGRDGAFKNDVWWSEDGATWNEATNNAPFSARWVHQVVAYNNRLWVIGGLDGSRRYNDVWWSQDGATWTEVMNNADFSPRHSPTVVAHNDRLWVIGGHDGAFKNDVWWSQDGATWTEVPPEERGSEHFSARSSHQVVVYDDQLWLIGGLADDGYKNDVWRSEDGATWEEVLPTNPTPTDPRFSERSDHQVALYDDKLWVIGGWNGTDYYDDVWQSEDGQTWEQVVPTDPHFSERSHHQVVAHNDQLWVIGGWEGGSARKNDVWRLLEDGQNWEKVVPTGTPFSERSHHEVAVHNNLLWLIGGYDSARKNDVWWSEDGVRWTQATGSADFSPRNAHRVVAHNDQLWVIGGWDGARKNDVWRSEDGENWRLGFHRVFQFR